MAKKYLEQFIPLVNAIAGTLGKNCEVVLHDFSKPHRSIMKIVNGHVTGRDVGDPASLSFSYLKERQKNDAVIGYRAKTDKGIELKSTTVFIRDSKNNIVGALCINIDITPYISMRNVSEEFCSGSDIGKPEARKEPPKKFEPSVDSMINELLRRSIQKIGKPIVHMRKEDKLRIIRELKGNGLFLIKGSTKRVAQELHVSLPTIYKYLEEI